VRVPNRVVRTVPWLVCGSMYRTCPGRADGKEAISEEE
jgi:hypothetical protein